MRSRTVALALASLASVTSAFAAPTIGSDFNAPPDPNFDGWKTVRIDATNLGFIGSPADPGWTSGHLAATEASGGLFVYLAPAKFLGDKSAYFNGTFSFDLSDDSSDGVPYESLLLAGNGLGLGYRSAAPLATGSAYAIPLAQDGNWRKLGPAGFTTLATDAEILSALGGLQYLAINADWTTGHTDVTTLDNVALAPVPEPATLAVLALGLFPLARRRR